MSSNQQTHLSRTASRTDTLPPLAEVIKHRRILLTGATGFLGKVLVYLLLLHHPELKRLYLLIRGDSKSSLNRFRREIIDSPIMGPLRQHLRTAFDRHIEERITVVAGDIGNLKIRMRRTEAQHLAAAVAAHADDADTDKPLHQWHWS